MKFICPHGFSLLDHNQSFKCAKDVLSEQFKIVEFSGPLYSV